MAFYGPDHYRTLLLALDQPTPVPERRRYRLWLLSDLDVHAAAGGVPAPPDGIDALVVAGGPGTGLARSIRRLADKLPADRKFEVVVVPGPRAFEDGVPIGPALDAARQVAAETSIRILHDSGARIGPEAGDGLVLLGAVFWPDLVGPAARPVESRAHARARWPVCKTVRTVEGPFLPHDAVGAHARSAAFLADALLSIWTASEGYGAPSVLVPGVRAGDRAVVLTAHPPDRRFLGPDKLATAFPWSVCWTAPGQPFDFDAPGAPAAWLHGGVPYAADTRVGRTRIVANPVGNGTTGFDPARVITV